MAEINRFTKGTLLRKYVIMTSKLQLKVELPTVFCGTILILIGLPQCLATIVEDSLVITAETEKGQTRRTFTFTEDGMVIVSTAIRSFLLLFIPHICHRTCTPWSRRQTPRECSKEILSKTSTGTLIDFEGQFLFYYGQTNKYKNKNKYNRSPNLTTNS